jgi:hypothetical protein
MHVLRVSLAAGAAALDRRTGAAAAHLRRSGGRVSGATSRKWKSTPRALSQHSCADTVMQPSSARAEVTTLPKMGTKCTTLPRIPTATGNTVRNFSTHGQLSTAQGSPTTSQLDIRLIQHFDSLAARFGPEKAQINWRYSPTHFPFAWLGASDVR